MPAMSAQPIPAPAENRCFPLFTVNNPFKGIFMTATFHRFSSLDSGGREKGEREKGRKEGNEKRKKRKK